MKDIVEEIVSIEKFTIQKIWSTHNQCLVLEIFHKTYKKLYLIISLNNDFFIYIQPNKPLWNKANNNFLLLIKKYFINSLVNIYINNNNYKEILLINNYSKLVIKYYPKNMFLFHENNIYCYHKEQAPNIKFNNIKFNNNNFIKNIHFAQIINEKYINYQQKKEQNLLLKKLKKQQKLISNLQNDLKKWHTNLQLESIANLIINNLHNISIKDKKIICTDYSNNKIENKEIIIPQNLNVKEYLDLLYKTIKKAKRAIPFIEERIKNEAQVLSLPRQNTTFIVDKKPRKRLPFKEFISSDNIPILVGKSAKDSDEMLRSYASGNDFWFHVKDAASAHVIVKYKNNDLPNNTLLEACMLAFHFSKQTSYNIQYTKVKWVKKIKGAKAGQVIITQEKTIFITIDENKLNNLIQQNKI